LFSTSLWRKWRVHLQALSEIARKPPVIIFILFEFATFGASLLDALADGVPLGEAIVWLVLNAPFVLLLQVAGLAAIVFWLAAVMSFLGLILLIFVGLRRAVQVLQGLRAGRSIENARRHESLESANARELLDLNPTFTKAELRSAWLRLAKELHPDRWILSGQAVRQMKEAALKRVNAARDELPAQAL
jgi:hypothetical protein